MMKLLQYLAAMVAVTAIVAAGAHAQSDSSRFEITSRHTAVQIFPSANAITCLDTIVVHRLQPKAHRLTLSLITFFEVDAAFINGKEASFKRGK
jgi:hypothetical protein